MLVKNLYLGVLHNRLLVAVEYHAAIVGYVKWLVAFAVSHARDDHNRNDEQKKYDEKNPQPQRNSRAWRKQRTHASTLTSCGCYFACVRFLSWSQLVCILCARKSRVIEFRVCNLSQKHRFGQAINTTSVFSTMYWVIRWDTWRCMETKERFEQPFEAPHEAHRYPRTPKISHCLGCLQTLD